MNNIDGKMYLGEGKFNKKGYSVKTEFYHTMDVNACDKCGKTAPPHILNTHKFGICVGCGFPIVRGDEFDNARIEAVQGDECHLNMPERIHATRTISCLKMPEYRPSYVTALDVINAHKRDAFKAEQATFKSFHDQADAGILVERPKKENFAVSVLSMTDAQLSQRLKHGLDIEPYVKCDFKDELYENNQMKELPDAPMDEVVKLFPDLDTFRESFKEALESQPNVFNPSVNTKHNLKINENVVNFFKKFKWTNER